MCTFGDLFCYLKTFVTCWLVIGGCHELTDKFRRILRGHTDAVWDLVVLPGHDNVLVSCAADSTCRLWRHDAEQPLLATVDISDGVILLSLCRSQF